MVLPQLKVITEGSNRNKFLRRIRDDSGKPKVNLAFQKDESDPRIVAIKYKITGRENDDSILYYSEAFNKHTIITANLGYDYYGRIVVKDFNDHKLGVSLEHLAQKENLRSKHIENINRISGIRRDLTPEYVARRYENIFYSLPEFLDK